jgi:hypothetical protein
MEEQILNILLKWTKVSGDKTHVAGRVESAKEIASHVMEFIRWLTLYTIPATTYSPMFYMGGSETIDTSKEHHIDDLYQHWLENIYNK